MCQHYGLEIPLPVGPSELDVSHTSGHFHDHSASQWPPSVNWCCTASDFDQHPPRTLWQQVTALCLKVLLMSLSLNGSQIVASFGETSSGTSYSDGHDPPVTRDRSLWTADMPSVSVRQLSRSINPVPPSTYCTAEHPSSCFGNPMVTTIGRFECVTSIFAQGPTR